MCCFILSLSLSSISIKSRTPSSLAHDHEGLQLLISQSLVWIYNRPNRGYLDFQVHCALHILVGFFMGVSGGNLQVMWALSEVQASNARHDLCCRQQPLPTRSSGFLLLKMWSMSMWQLPFLSMCICLSHLLTVSVHCCVYFIKGSEFMLVGELRQCRKRKVNIVY